MIGRILEVDEDAMTVLFETEGGAVQNVDLTGAEFDVEYSVSGGTTLKAVFPDGAIITFSEPRKEER